MNVIPIEDASKRPVRRRMAPDDRKKQIVAVTASVFDQQGFANTTMDSIASEIGIAKATLYYYFPSKDDLLLAIHEEFIELLHERHAQRASAGMRPEQLLLEAMADILELMETHHGHVRVFFEHHRDLPPEARARVRARRDAYEQIVSQLIEDATTDGTFRESNPLLSTMATFGMCNWAYQWYRPTGGMRPREVAYQFWSLLMYGLASEDTRKHVSSGRGAAAETTTEVQP